MARRPSGIQVLITHLEGMVERARGESDGSVAALERIADVWGASLMARKAALDIRAAVQSLNIGLEEVPDEHLLTLINKWQREQDEYDVFAESVERAKEANIGETSK